MRSCPAVLRSCVGLVSVLQETQDISILEEKQDYKTENILPCVMEEGEEENEEVKVEAEHGDTPSEDFSSSSLNENTIYTKRRSCRSYGLVTPETIEEIGTSETEKQDQDKTEAVLKQDQIIEDEYEFPY